MTSKARQLQWLIGVRIVAISSMAVPYVGLSAGASASRFILGLAGVTYLLSLVYVVLLKLLRERVNTQACIQLTADLGLVTALVWVGAASSAFSVLYLVVIALAATLLPSRLALFLANVASVMYTGLMLCLARGWLPTADGEPFDTRFLVYNLGVHIVGFNAMALLVSYISQSMDEARRRLEQKQEDLTKLESFHRDVTDSLSSGLLTTDERGMVVTINPSGARILGRTGAGIRGRPVFEVGLCDEEDWRRVSASSHTLGMQREESRHGEGDEEVSIGYSVSQFHEGGERARGYIVTFQDVTRFRKLEQELRFRDRMAAIGQLSAGIAHEIRNPLAAISGSVQMLSSSLPASGSSSKLFDIIKKESKRLDRTIEGFLQFARPREKEEQWFDIATLLRDSVQLLKNSDQVSGSHSVDLDLYPPTLQFLGDRDQLSQIFWNLARNALSAMPDGGRLLVQGAREGNAYRIRFCDEGRGMSEEECRGLFQPFKTSFDGGSGLGMAIVYRLVREHDGEISAESEPGSGTTVTIDLPIREQEVSLSA